MSLFRIGQSQAKLRDYFGSPIVFLRLTAVAVFGFVAVRA
jgi:hypothetical protein